ncbi:hypothetical protein EVAR_51127_1 [Eumeta japonica]|uniref:Uncharacterized protein n=1 Tax=Eumeta variegata TaxID=151549 RepID=A0A4C1YC24_EUMVA|nr:hypothetical protein EVAR_51127_1 [Eumeta japonica]
MHVGPFERNKIDPSCLGFFDLAWQVLWVFPGSKNGGGRIRKFIYVKIDEAPSGKLTKMFAKKTRGSGGIDSVTLAHSTHRRPPRAAARPGMKNRLSARTFVTPRRDERKKNE